jgi:hypothetical protein
VLCNRIEYELDGCVVFSNDNGLQSLKYTSYGIEFEVKMEPANYLLPMVGN